MPFVKLTNNHPNFKDMPIYINTDHILSVYEVSQPGGSLSCAVFGTHGREWFPEQSLNEVMKLIKDAENEQR